jgi:multidrug efflux pump
MLISAINAMTLTPALAVLFFAGRKPGAHGEQDREALPWWSFALFGGLATVWLLTPIFGEKLGLAVGDGHEAASPGGLKSTIISLGAYMILFLPGHRVAGGCRLLIRPVNQVGKFFHGFNVVFERRLAFTAVASAGCLRLSASCWSSTSA